MRGLLFWLAFIMLGVYVLGSFALPRLMDTRGELIERMDKQVRGLEVR